MRTLLLRIDDAVYNTVLPGNMHYILNIITKQEIIKIAKYIIVAMSDYISIILNEQWNWLVCGHHRGG